MSVHLSALQIYLLDTGQNNALSVDGTISDGHWDGFHCGFFSCKEIFLAELKSQ